MKMDEFDQHQNILLESALNELAIVPLPPDFTNQVMANIYPTNAHSVHTHAVPSTPVRFRLQFLDIALALFWSLALILIWMITLWWTGLLRLDWLPQTQISFSFVDQLSLTNPSLLVGGIILLLLEISVLALLGVNLLGERPAVL